MNLFEIWEEAHKNKKLPKEWVVWDDFRAWAIANHYKAESGYKGEFNPQGCLKAMQPVGEFDTNKTTTTQKSTKLAKNKTAAAGKGVNNAGKKTSTGSRSRNGV